MQIIQHKTEFHITIPWNHWRVRNTDAVKNLTNRRFDGVKKVWIAPIHIHEEVMQLVKNCKAELLVMEDHKAIEITDLPPMPALDIDFEIKSKNEGFELREYQRYGIAQTLKFQQTINGDEQGLGKTIQSSVSIYVAERLGLESFPCLVICPASMKMTWKREIENWTGCQAVILDDKNKATWQQFYHFGMAQYFIVNYESLKKFFVKSMPPKGHINKSTDIIMDERVELFNSIIIDESHRCKDPKTLQTKLALRLALKKKWRILLTGTPVVNKPIDLFAQLAILGQLEKFGGSKNFRTRYCEGGNGAANLKELNFLLRKNCFFRREKKDVAKDLPEKQRQTILCDITTRSEYNKAKNDFVKFLEEQGWDDAEIRKKLRGEIMVKMGELKKISAAGKLNEVKEFIHEVIDSGEKLILFAVHHFIVDEILKEFPKAVTVTGRDDSYTKQKAIDGFQKNPDVKLIVCNIKAAGVGITLTASSRVAFIEYPWTYADCVQCEDRAHRIGQKNNVMCTYFLGEKTIDEDLYKMIQEKRHTANAITGATDEMEMNFVDSVFELFKK